MYNEHLEYEVTIKIERSAEDPANIQENLVGHKSRALDNYYGYMMKLESRRIVAPQFEVRVLIYPPILKEVV